MSEERSNHSEGRSGSGRSGGYGKGGYNKGRGGKFGGGRGGYGKGRGGFDRRGDGEGRRFHRDGEFHRGNGDRPNRGEGQSEGRGENRSGGFRKDYGRKPYGDRKFHRDGDRRDFRRDGGFRKDFHKDGDRRFDDRDDRRGEGRRFDRDGERGGFKRDGGFRKDRDFHRDGDRRDFRKGGFHKDGERGDRRDFHRDGERGGFRKDFHKDGSRRFDREDRGGFRKDGERRDFHRDGDRNDRRDFKRDGGFKKDRDFHKDGGFRKDFHKDGERGERRDFHRDDRRDDRRGPRNDRPRNDRPFDRQGGNPRYQRDGEGSHSFYQGGRRNSDGTVSYPSQNPYTDRRPNEPKMPKGLEWRMLSKDEKERLRGLSKEHAENIGLHMLAAYTLEESDPDLALAHAKWVARQASRIDMARETLAFVAYRQQNYKLALKEFRTAYRMNGFLDYLPFIADCERGVGQPKKAIEMASQDDVRALRGESKAEMLLVIAGAYGDLGLWDKAIELVHTLGRSKGISGEYRMRAVQAEQNFLEQAGRHDEAMKLDDLLDRLEDEYAEVDEEDDDTVVDNDLEDIDDELLEGLGIDTDPSHYPDDEPADEDAEDSDQEADEDDDVDADGDSDDKAEPETTSAVTPEQIEDHDTDEDNPRNADDETRLPAQEAEDGANADEDPGETAEADAEQSEEAADAEQSDDQDADQDQE
ncbi:tetratricopeptide repeat protein [Bifidobacterium simiarum]|uniref:Helicase n=1 Tax=Bifidobacterium simiarum TaxID=2045441 RepID=A0A2M9HED7_9BIFI|nr:tetratricopeptide repeat protein [Bifidobacterium simiarum]PJM75162.1 helicase [Bifidobacterium simiarum]